MKSVVCDCIETSFRVWPDSRKARQGSQRVKHEQRRLSRRCAVHSRGLCHGGQLTSKLLKLSRTGREHVAP